MNVLLVHPPYVRTSYFNRFQIYEPLAHLYVASALQPRHPCRLIDLRFHRSLDRELRGFAPDVAVVGVSPLTCTTVKEILEQLRDRFPRLPVLLIPNLEYGSSHVGERPEDFVEPLADALVPEEMTVVLRKVVPAAVDALEAGQDLRRVPGLLVPEPSGTWSSTGPVHDRGVDIGLPDRSLLGDLRGRYVFAGIRKMTNLFYTYGCLYKCDFCPMSKHDGSIVRRPVEHVVAELEEMTEPNVFLMDFEPFLHPGGMEELATALEETSIRKRFYMLIRADSALENLDLLARWKKLGLTWIYVGLDGHTEERLRRIHKATTVDVNERAVRELEKLGLAVTVGFVVPPHFSREDFADLRSYVRRLRPPLMDFTIETPIVGTRLFDEERSRITTTDWSLYGMDHAVLPTRLPLKVFYREMTRLHLLAGRNNIPAMLRFYSLRDTLINWCTGIGAVRDSLFAARDHEAGPLFRRKELAAPGR